MVLPNYRRLLLLPVLGALLFYSVSTLPEKTSRANTMYSSYSVSVSRGAFHYDAFLLEGNVVQHIPDTTANPEHEKYALHTTVMLDSAAVHLFVSEIENQGFWDLDDSYPTQTSCTSSLTVTVRKGTISKAVSCEDYIENCPDLLKYIEQKIVELEGNELKRIYLPG